MTHTEQTITDSIKKIDNDLYYSSLHSHGASTLIIDPADGEILAVGGYGINTRVLNDGWAELVNVPPEVHGERFLSALSACAGKIARWLNDETGEREDIAIIHDMQSTGICWTYSSATDAFDADGESEVLNMIARAGGPSAAAEKYVSECRDNDVLLLEFDVFTAMCELVAEHAVQ